MTNAPRDNERDYTSLGYPDRAELDRYLDFLDSTDWLRTRNDGRRGSDRAAPSAGRSREADRSSRPTRVDPLAMDLEIRLAMCELAFARVMGHAGLPSVDSAGLVGDYRIQAVPRVGACLILRDCDPGAAVFIKAFAEPGGSEVWLEGWIRAGDGKRNEWRRDVGRGRGSVWFVPDAALNDLADLLPADGASCVLGR
jgi:hypothetical protein